MRQYIPIELSQKLGESRMTDKEFKYSPKTAPEWYLPNKKSAHNLILGKQNINQKRN